MNYSSLSIAIAKFTLIVLLSITPVFAQERDSMQLQDFDGFSNAEYEAYLAEDGWPAEKLNTGKDADYLSDDEKNLILAMNLTRYDPPKYAKLYVYPRLQYFDGTLFRFPGRTPLRTREGIEAVRELYLEYLETDQQPLLYPSKGLSRASADHARYMKKTGTASHEGMGGMDARASRHGQWVKGLSENLHWGATNAHEAIMSLMIDDGVKNRGHRINQMDPSYQKVGVAIEEHPRLRRSYVINFAVDFIEKE